MREMRPRPKVKMVYKGRAFRFGRTVAIIGVILVKTGAKGIMYASPDAPPCRYGME